MHRCDRSLWEFTVVRCGKSCIYKAENAINNISFGLYSYFANHCTYRSSFCALRYKKNLPSLASLLNGTINCWYLPSKTIWTPGCRTELAGIFFKTASWTTNKQHSSSAFIKRFIQQSCFGKVGWTPALQMIDGGFKSRPMQVFTVITF